MRMIDLGSYGGPLSIDTLIAIDCTKDVCFRHSFRSLVKCMVPCCGFQPTAADSPGTASTTTVTGTFFGYRRGHVSFCLHDSSSRAAAPLLLLEFAVSTTYLAQEMQHDLLRIMLECDRARAHARYASLFAADLRSHPLPPPALP